MSKQTQTLKVQDDKNVQPKATPDVAPVMAGLAQLPVSGVTSNGFLKTQADKLDQAWGQTAQRQALAARIGQVQGNQHLQRVMALHPAREQLSGGLLQRQDSQDAGMPPAVADPARPTFSQAEFSQTGERFDSTYTPVGPAPQVGNLDVNLWVHITFAPFTRAMMRQEPYRSHRFTRDQLADFEWTDAEREKFEVDFMSSVMGAWGGKFTFHLDDTDFAEYRSNVTVNVMTISDPGQAHTKITAQKVPKDAPRFRSFVSGDEATLDIRDPSEPETAEVFDRKLVRQIKPFDFDSAALAPVEGQVNEVDQKLQQIGATIPPGTKDWVIILQGRASARGSRAYNKQLAQQRAEAVRGHISADLSWAEVRVNSVGEENASEDEAFQRVDVSVRSKDRVTVTQNVAAHEAGHMFGLDDEYVEEKPDPGVEAKFFGDEPSHFGDVQAHIGTDEANELLTQNSDSMMSMGSTVHKGHYVYFLEALNSMTGKTWKVE